MEAERKIHEIKKDIIIIPVSDLQEYLKEAQASLEGKSIENKEKELRPYQKEALESVITRLKLNKK